MPDQNITVLVLNSVKKVKSFKVNRFRIRFAIFSIGFLSAIFIISIGMNYYLYLKNQDVSSQLALVRQPGESGIISQVDEDFNGDAVLRTASNESSDTAAIAEQPGTAVVESGSEAVESMEDIFINDYASGLVNIENLQAIPELNRIELNINFNVVNTSGVDDAVAGYIVVVARTSDDNMPYVSWPYMELNDSGEAAYFMRGDRFSIKFLRPVDARMLLNDPSERFIYYRIYIYSMNGDMMLKKTYSITE